MAQVLLQHHLDARRVEGRVHSAGELRGGVPASAGSVRAMEARGLDLDDHRSRRMTPDLLAGADLVVGMARRHVREAVLTLPEAWPRIFTLKELVRRAEGVGPRAEGQPLAAWLARLEEGRRPADLMGDAAADDIADPIGSPDQAYERTATELASLVDRLVDLAFGATAPVGSSVGAAPSSETAVSQEG